MAPADPASPWIPPDVPQERSLHATPMVRFGPYELDLESGDLRKFGYRIKLQPKSFLVLRALLHAPGEMVTREELRAQLWPENTFVEFESSLNVAVRRLREALSDEAQGPTYIETVPKHGYRFIGLLEPPSRYRATLSGARAGPPSWRLRIRPRLAAHWLAASKLCRTEVGGGCCCRPWRC